MIYLMGALVVVQIVHAWIDWYLTSDALEQRISDGYDRGWTAARNAQLAAEQERLERVLAME